jgi:hypothetical protein
MAVIWSNSPTVEKAARNLVNGLAGGTRATRIRLGVTVATTRFSPVPKPQQRSVRRQVALPARLTWKDASGAVRFTSVMTRDVSEAGVFVDAKGAATIPLYRIVHLQLERPARDVEGIPARLRDGRVRSAVWRIAPCHKSTGTPSGYALRFLVDPYENAGEASSETRMAVAS